MNIEKKLIELDKILEESEVVKFVEKNFDADTSEEMVLELRIKLIELLTK